MGMDREEFGKICRFELKHTLYMAYGSRYVRKEKLEMLIRMASKVLKNQEHLIKKQYLVYLESQDENDWNKCEEMLTEYRKEKECLNEFFFKIGGN